MGRIGSSSQWVEPLLNWCAGGRRRGDPANVIFEFSLALPSEPARLEETGWRLENAGARLAGWFLTYAPTFFKSAFVIACFTSKNPAHGSFFSVASRSG